MPSLKQQLLDREKSPGKGAKEAGCRCSTCTFRARGTEGGSEGRSRGKGEGDSCKLVAFELDKRATVESKKKQVDPERVQRNRSRNRSSSRSMDFMPSLRKKVLDREDSLGREDWTSEPESDPDARPKTPRLRNGSTTSPDSRKCSNCCDKKEEEEEDEEEESCQDCSPHASTMKTVAGQKDKATNIEVQACGCSTALTLAGLEVSLLLRHV